MGMLLRIWSEMDCLDIEVPQSIRMETQNYKKIKMITLDNGFRNVQWLNRMKPVPFPSCVLVIRTMVGQGVW